MLRYRATLAYDGTAYYGFQRQAAHTPTIQLALETAIAKVTGQSVTVLGAGRTDAGVHATGQVIAFDVAWRHADPALLRAINAHLPDDIALQSIRQHAGFHPRYDALSRRYAYTVIIARQRQPLFERYAWRVREPLNGAVMQAAAQLLIGEHDFATFGQPPQGENTVRYVLVSQWSQTDETYGTRLTYTVEANAFLHHMVRRMVAIQVEVGQERRTLDTFEADFKAADIARARAIAPPQGLVLTAVQYPDE